jgi:endo-1,4-beta-xylanase
MITRRDYLKQASLAGCCLAITGTRAFAAAAQQLAAAPELEISGKGSLKAHGSKRGILAGSAIGARQLPDEAFQRLIAEQYDIVVSENSMKFGPLSPMPGEYNWADADALVDFAQKHQMKIRGHNFVWHEQLPVWFKETATKDNAKKIMVDHINTLAGRYKGKIHSWDVVNEAINIGDGMPDGLRKSPWYELIGPEYLDIAYRTARQVDPSAKLTYNEYGIENDSESNAKKRAATLALLKRFKANGTPIDALGVQSHIHAGTGETYGKGLRELIFGAQDLGLEVYLTELDVNDDGVQDDDSAVRDRAVADVYKDYLAIALESKAVKAVLTWGVSDKNTWLNGMKEHREKRPNRSQRPLPFDNDLKPTPAFFAMRDQFDKAPKR